MGDDRPSVYQEGDRWVYRASALGNCIRGLVAVRKGITPAPHPDWLLKAFRQGSRNEPVILRMLYDQGHFFPTTYGSQTMAELPVGTKALIRGHVDDVAYDKVGYEWTVEAKALAESNYEKYKREGLEGFPYYAMQVSIYMAARDAPVLFVIGVKNRAGEVVRLDVTPFTDPPIPASKIKAKVAKIESLVARDEWPDCDWEQYPCQFYFLHDDKYPITRDHEVTAALESSVNLLSLESYADRYLQGQRMVREGTEIVRAEGELIAEWFRSESVTRAVTKGYEVRLVNGEPLIKKRRDERDEDDRGTGSAGVGTFGGNTE